MELKPLVCPDCGGAVPLGPGSTCPCPSCNGQVPIPQNYVEWRFQKEQKLLAEETLINLHERLGKTPKRWEIWLANLKGGCGCGGCLLFFVTMYIGGLLLRALVALWNQFAPASWQQVNPDGGASFLVTAIVLLPYLAATTFVVMALAYTRRKVLTLATLQGKLLASPPVHAGGPSTCRACGGPLSVQPGQLCSPCYYCGSQNLVALEPEWCDQLRASTDQSQESFAEAMAVYDETTAKARKKMFGYGVFFLFLAWFLTSSMKSDEAKRWPPKGFESYVKQQRVLTLNRGQELALGQPIHFDFHQSNMHVPGELQNYHAVYFFVPLQQGEKLNVSVSEASTPAVVKTIPLNDSKDIVEGRRRLNWRTVSGSPPVVTADQKSWYAVSIQPAKEVEHAFYTVEFTVAGRKPEFKVPNLGGVAVESVPLNWTPNSAPEQQEGSEWLKAGNAEVKLDSNGRVERVRGKALTAPGIAEAGKPWQAWLQAFGPGATSEIYREKQPSGYELYFEHVYTDRQTVLTVKVKDNKIIGFELSRGEKNDGKSPSTAPKGTPITSLVNKPDLSQATPFNDFAFDRTQGFEVRGITPGTTREKAEKILGKPSLEWTRYAYYGDQTVCYWNGKVRWIWSPYLSQGGRLLSMSGPSQFQKDKIGERFLSVHESVQPRGLPSCLHDGSFYRFGDHVLVVFEDNGEIIGGAVMSAKLFPDKPKLVIKNGTAKLGDFSIKQGTSDLDPLLSYFGPDFLQFLFAHSSKQHLLPEALADGTETRSFQYWIGVGMNRVQIDYWKQKFITVKTL